MSRTINTLAFVGVVGATAGFVAMGAHPAEQGPQTLAEIEHQLGTGNQLGSLVASQTLDFKLQSGENVTIRDLAHSDVSANQLQTVATLADNYPTQNPDIDMHIGDEERLDQGTKISLYHNPATRHQLLLVPNDFVFPKKVTDQWQPGDNFQALTNTFPGETISLVKVGNNLPEALGNIATELCQTLTTAQADPQDSNITNTWNRIAKEGLCNSEGDAAEEALLGKAYTAYTHFNAYTPSSININGVDVETPIYAIPSEAYDALAKELRN